jgi:predicted ATPase
MITRLELDGFKTFHDFKLELTSFQVIVGVNGSGKSNLFDALRLLSRLSTTDLRSAFQQSRGEAGELFTIQPHGQPTSTMSLAVELLVDRSVQDNWGEQANLKFTRLRYELKIERRFDERGLERLSVTHEQLEPIARQDDGWLRRQIGSTKHVWLPELKGGRGTAFISTDTEREPGTIYLHQDGRGGRKASVAERVEQTVLSSVTDTSFPHTVAVREEMRSWHFLQLNPEVLRQPGPMLETSFVAPDGSHLPNALARLKAEDAFLLTDISRDMANLVSGIVKVDVEEDRSSDRYVIYIKTEDGRSFSSRVLSDGTLRLLTLVTLKNDPLHRGVLCFEEPENGVHPSRLTQVAHLLQDMATDFNDTEQANEPLRQLLINTHSPSFISQANIMPSLLFAHLATHIQPGQHIPPMRMTRIVPVNPDRQLKLELGIDEPEYVYTLGQVMNYLNNAEVEEARSTLQEGGL